MKEQDNTSRRKSIQQSGMLGAGVMLAATSQLFAEIYNPNIMSKNIKSKGYAEKTKMETYPCGILNAGLLAMPTF